MSEYSELYREIIEFHNSHPFHYEKREEAGQQVEAYNPVCGDHYHLYYDLNGEQSDQVSFHGYGCAISKASTSILVKYLSEHDLEEFRETFLAFRQMLLEHLDEERVEPPLEELEAFMGIRKNPSRYSCATLAWQALYEHLENKK